MKIKFRDSYLKYKAQSSYKQNLQYWITEYKSIDNNKCIVYYFVNLSINTQNDYILKPSIELFNTELKQFDIFFDWLKGFKSIIVINTLADNTFKY